MVVKRRFGRSRFLPLFEASCSWRSILFSVKKKAYLLKWGLWPSAPHKSRFWRWFSRFQKVSGKENGNRRSLVVSSFLASIHVSTFYFKGADKGRMMLIECPKCPLLTYFCLILPLWGVRKAADHTSQNSLPFRTAAADRPRAGMPAPISHT